MFPCIVESCFKQLVLLTMNPTCMLTINISSREQMPPRPLPNPMTKPSLGSVSDPVLVATQLELIRSSGVLVCMCALTQHSYAVLGSNPLTWTLVVLALMLGTFTSWICPSDSADAVHDKSYPLMILSLGIDCCSDHFIITEVESTWMEMSCGNLELTLFAACVLHVASCHWSSIHTSTILP